MTEEPRNEKVLVKRARAGDRVALTDLLDRSSSRVFRYSMKMCGDENDAQEVVQETLLSMARGVGELRNPDALFSWLYRIARSFCIKKRRKSKFAPARELSLEQESESGSAPIADRGRNPEEAYSDAELGGALQRAVDGLDGEYREVLLLRDIEGLTASEVSEVLDISVAAVKSRLHRARAAIRRQLAPLMGVAEPASAGAGQCPEMVRSFSRHLEGELSPVDCREMEQHLSTCESCRSSCDTLKRTLALCAASRDGEVPEKTRQAVQRALDAYLRDQQEKQSGG
jgi:RNA polymerase sigma-70 factor (ECF subfamily)